ncbi:MAG: Sporulation domain protein, partial [bacterium]|nr:Sporulation domain protein [bacterium]
MRDLDRWKDKVEISLDGRQIFFLFFGSAVAACLIFVTGVLIGKRIEARALALQPAPIEDPLAALDQLGDADEADEGLTFHKALAPPKAEKPAVEAKKTEKPAVEAKKAEKPAVEAKKIDKPVVAKPAVAKPAVAVSDDKADDDDGNDAKPVVEPKPEAKLPPPKPQALPAARPQVVQQAAAKKPDATAAHFTLQLSAFPDKADAEEFMRKIQSAGYKPFLVASEIPGKGVFYRVRVGDYGSRQAAVDAKSEFE